MARILQKKALGEAVRFAIVGVLSTALHYAIYWILQHRLNASLSWTVGYLLSFFFNFYLSARFTFHAQASARRGAGFAGAHLFNYCLQIALLNLFLWLGLSREVAPLGVYAIAVPVNFLFVRYVFKHFKRP